MKIEAAILHYVSLHPAAKDTVEGIAAWWLLEPQLHAGIAEVKVALERLVVKGRMAAEQQADGRIYYHQAKSDEKNSVTKRDVF